MSDVKARPEEARNVKRVGHSDINGWGDAFQVIVRDNRWCYVAASGMNGHEGTSVLDAADPKNPKVLTQIPAPTGTHSHKVLFLDDVMIVNAEQIRGWEGEGFLGGIRLFDASDPAKPKFIKNFPMYGRGTHRPILDTKNRMLYCSCGAPGYRGNILWILDIGDPANPKVVSQFALEGQREGTPLPPGVHTLQFHQSNRRGDHLYCGCADWGVVVLDVKDPARPRQVGHFNPTPPYPGHCHTVLPVPETDLLVVTHESTSFEVAEAPGFIFIYDAKVPSNPVPISTWMPYPVDPKTLYPKAGDWTTRGGRYGAHNLWEFMGPRDFVYTTWFNAGLRIVDISDPFRPEEVGYYVPAGINGRATPQSNDVFVDGRGLVYVTDRWGCGLDILEYTGPR